ncbi:hypothetical protein ACHAXT_003315 [Thalassiosira profunda]
MDKEGASPATAEATALRCPSDRDLRVPCYCEENAWRLAHRHLHGPDAASNRSEYVYRVVFVSNERRCCPFFRQRARPDDPSEYVCWDYHVFVIRSQMEGANASIDTEVLDMDTWLPYPCPLDDYLDGSFPHTNNLQLDAQYLPLFRVIPAECYLKYFYSDRMHMFKDGKWQSPPPAYAPIMNGMSLAGDAENHGTKDGALNSNLEMYINMTGGEGADDRKGEVLTLDTFRARFSRDKR